MTRLRILSIAAAVVPILVGQGLAAAPITTPQPATNVQQNKGAVPARAPAPPAALLQYKRIAKLHGMAGVGTGELTADMFIKLYGQVIQASDGAPAGFGTDTDGLVMGMPHRSGSSVRYDAKFPRSSLGTKQWDYNRDGVAHYGMIADFVKDLETLPGAADLINDHLMNGADYFLDSWLHAEAQKTKVK